MLGPIIRVQPWFSFRLTITQSCDVDCVRNMAEMMNGETPRIRTVDRVASLL